MANEKQTPVAPIAQVTTPEQAKRDEQARAKTIADGHATLPGTDPEGKQVSPKLEGATTAEVPSELNTHPAGLAPNPRQFDNGVRATLPEDAEIGPDSPHDNPMPGTNQVNPSAESVVAAGGALDPTSRQQPLAAGG